MNTKKTVIIHENDIDKTHEKKDIIEIVLFPLTSLLSFLYFGLNIKFVVATLIAISVISAFRGKFTSAIFYFVPVILIGLIV